MMLHTFNTPPDIHSDISKLMQFADLLQQWMVYRKEHHISVGTAADVWNVEPEDIIDAAEIQPFLVVEEFGYFKRQWMIGHCDER